MVAMGDMVLYVTRVTATKRDPRGLGDTSVPTNPASFGRLPAVVVRVLAVGPPTRVALFVFSLPAFTRLNCSQFDSLNPLFDTWEPRP